MASDLGTSVLTLSTDSAKFDKGMDSAKAKMEKFGGAMKKVGAGISALGAGFALMAANLLDEADKIGKASTAIGIDVERLQGFIHAANIASGISAEAMRKSFINLTKNIAAAKDGTKSFSDIFDRMNISIEDGTGKMKSADQVLLEMANHVRAAGGDTRALADVAVLLGGKMANLKNLLELGSDGIEAYIKEAKKFGVMTEAQVRSAEAFNDAVARLTMSVKGLFFAFLDSGWMKQLIDMIEVTARWIAETGRAHPMLLKVALGFAAVSIVLGPLIIGLGLLVASLKVLAPILSVASVLLLWKVWVGVAVAGLVYFLATNERVKKTIVSLWHWIGRTFDLAARQIDKAMRKVSKVTSKAWRGITSNTKASLIAMLGHIARSWKKISSITSSSWKAIQKLFTTAYKSLGKGTLNSAKYVLKVWTSLWISIKKAIINGANLVLKKVVAFGNAVLKIFGDLFKKLIGNSSIVRNMIAGIVNAFSAMKKALVGVTGIVTTTGKLIGPIFGGSMDEVNKQLSRIKNVFIPKVKTDMDTLIDSKHLDAVSSLDATGSLNNLEKELKRIGDEFNPKVKSSMDQLKDDDHLGGVSALEGLFTTVFGGMGGAVGGLREKISLFPEIFAKIKESMKNLGKEATGEGGLKMLEGIAAIIGSRLTGWKGTLFTVLANARSIYKELKSWTTGKKLLEIKKMFESWKLLLTNVVGIIKDVFGIFTDSKIFKDVLAILKEVKDWVLNFPKKIKAFVDEVKAWIKALKDLAGILSSIIKKIGEVLDKLEGGVTLSTIWESVKEIFKGLKESIKGAKDQMLQLNASLGTFIAMSITAKLLGLTNIGFTMGPGNIGASMLMGEVAGSTFATALNTNLMWIEQEKTHDLIKRIGYAGGNTIADHLKGAREDLRAHMARSHVLIQQTGNDTVKWLQKIHNQNVGVSDVADVMEAEASRSDLWLRTIADISTRTAMNTSAIRAELASGVSINQPITVNVAGGTATAQGIGAHVTAGMSQVMHRENNRIIAVLKDALNKNSGGIRRTVKKLGQPNIRTTIR